MNSCGFQFCPKKFNDVYNVHINSAKLHLLFQRAIPCRVAAASTLLLVMRENRDKIARQSVSDFFIHCKLRFHSF